MFSSRRQRRLGRRTNPYPPTNSKPQKRSQLQHDVNSRHPNPLPGHSQEQTTTTSADSSLFDRSLLNPIWQNARSIGPGLVNHHNSCFLNSVLQCLTYTPALAQYFMYCDHRGQCTLNGFCATCAMEIHVRYCLGDSNNLATAILPKAFLRHLYVFSPTLCLGSQEDAHEFMMGLLISMHKSTTQQYGKLDAETERTAFIYRIFGGQLRSQLRCRSCNAKSVTLENFLNLSIGIQDATTIHEALENFTKVDKIGGNDPESKYQCQSCGQKVDAEKQMTIHELPFYLCIQLKRFTFDTERGCMKKVAKDIQYGENLDMDPFISKDVDCPSTGYYLYAVLVHRGGLCEHGHYLAYVKAPDGCWFRMDDEKVEPVLLEEVLQKQAYILFYTTEKQVNMPIKNETSHVGILPNYRTDDPKAPSDQMEASSMELIQALEAATESKLMNCFVQDMAELLKWENNPRNDEKVYEMANKNVEDKVTENVNDSAAENVDESVEGPTTILGSYHGEYDDKFYNDLYNEQCYKSDNESYDESDDESNNLFCDYDTGDSITWIISPSTGYMRSPLPSFMAAEIDTRSDCTTQDQATPNDELLNLFYDWMDTYIQ